MRTRYNWRAAPSLNASFEGSRSICYRAFTYANKKLKISATEKSRAKVGNEASSATYSVERVDKELGDDPAAGTGEVVDQRV